MALAVVASVLGVLVARRVDATPPWVFVGGRIEPGELPAAAAERETREETGLEVVAGDEIGQRVHPRTGRLLIYLACTTDEPHRASVVATGELAELRWVDLDQLDALMPDLFEPVRTHLHSRTRHRAPGVSSSGRRQITTSRSAASRRDR